jgi:hypothetical protein
VKGSSSASGVPAVLLSISDADINVEIVLNM